ncbi:Gfo/Idh/MocA family oxidoreductase [Sulfobacillus sp. DSM 109850]|uniref:Gfo/Idh/MocA family oxidoreductase n=2 Tax=Sulfobacillus harzensis TaxID=2729629 RepID=A0A7Y0L4W5_9FIRM|nr:Gfo/Idh/MocA family oxidoreductase [Sulfobacillus harzensis]
MNIGILSFAHMHAYSYAAVLAQLEDVHLTVVADDDEERGRMAAQQWGAAYFRDYQRALREPLDAVIVTSENARHAEMVVAAFDAGMHVLVEKPIATSVADGMRMVDAADAAHCILQVAFPMRFNVPIAAVKKQIDRGSLGKVLAINGTNRGQNPGGWFVDPALAGGGAIMDHTVHVVDLMRWYTGAEVREVYAEVGRRFYDIPTDDAGLLSLEFDNGVIAGHDPSWSRPQGIFPTWGDVTLEVVGTERVARVDAYAQHVMEYSARVGHAVHRGWGDDPDALMIKSFIDACRHGRKPLVTGLDGVRATEVALFAYESARLGRPVRLR